MKGWHMIHQVKAMYNDGQGSSQRAIAKALGISRNTVKKYLSMSESEISKYQESSRRTRSLEAHRDYLCHLLRKYPKLSAVKTARLLKEANIETGVSLRTLRRYLRELKQVQTVQQARYFEPVLDMEPGLQCQVDGGELHQVEINKVSRSVYFIVFVLSYSRYMAVVPSPRPFTTESWIQAHDTAFRQMGGCCQEYVYDQTRLVVIEEHYREVFLNEGFSQYATTVDFGVRVCEGYDPQSKGKVEAGVKYVKNNFFYGESFQDWEHMENELQSWLENVANPRIHGTTKQVPKEVFQNQEQSLLKPYLSPDYLKASPVGVSRKVDKTGLLSYGSNKYSVPMKYQRARVWVQEVGSQLKVYDAQSHIEIAVHNLCLEKGQILKDLTHYRDREQETQDYEQLLAQRVGQELMKELSVVLKATMPTYYKDQLRALERLLKHYECDSKLLECLRQLAQRPKLRVSRIKAYLEAYLVAKAEKDPAETPKPKRSPLLEKYTVIPSPSSVPEASKEVDYELT